MQPACGQLVCTVDQVDHVDVDDEHNDNDDHNDNDNNNDNDNENDGAACKWSTGLTTINAGCGSL